MTIQNKEYDRVLKNPENFIVSEELQDIMFSESDSPDEFESDTTAMISISHKEYVCKLKRVERKEDSYKIKVQVPSLTFEIFLQGEDICLKIQNTLYTQREDQPVVYKDNRILTFTARRIIKDEEI